MKTEFETDLLGLNSKLFFGRVVAVRVLIGLAWAIRRQIGNKDFCGCNSRPLEKNTAFKFCLFSAALNSENSLSRNKFDY